jgi:hypothetical protein
MEGHGMLNNEQPPPSPLVPGDLLLFRSSGTWYEKLICFATRGPYVHVSVVIDNGMTIAAFPHGIAKVPIPSIPSAYTRVDIRQYVKSEANVRAGMLWLVQQAGKAYGWWDIVFQGFKFLIPGLTLKVVERGHFDCSDLACRYLQAVGVPGAEDLDPYEVSPNDLARFLGILPGGVA